MLHKVEDKKKQNIVIQQADLTPLIQAVESLPNKVLQTIIGSSNNQKGALGELIGYINLRASYDSIIPLSDIVDFVGIKLPSDKEDGHIDFIEVKTGTRSRLSDDQVGLKKIIKDKHINFIKLKVDTIQDEDTIK